MPQIETTNQNVRQLVGLHLYHDPLSSCAMRVRMVLVEKNLPWTSHVVDLSKMEHATPEYQSINPNGLVPTLIHDERTYIESIDIIQCLEEIAPSPSLNPADPKDMPLLKRLLATADQAQEALKHLTHEYLFRGTGRYLGEEDKKKFASAHRNAWLVEFKRGFAAEDAEWHRNLAAALREMDGYFRELDSNLAASDWLVNGSFTLADVAWTPNVHRMFLMEWPVANYPHLSRWYAQLARRRSFQKAVVDCEPPGVRAVFAGYVAKRRAAGTSVTDALERMAGERCLRAG